MAEIYQFVREREKAYGLDENLNQELEKEEYRLAQARRFLGLSSRQQEMALRCTHDPIFQLQNFIYDTNRAFDRLMERFTS